VTLTIETLKSPPIVTLTFKSLLVKCTNRFNIQQLYRGADKSLERQTSRCILFDGENISFDASLVIYICFVIWQGRQKNNSSRDEIYEKNSRIYLDRSQNKYTNYKGIKNNINSGQTTGIQEKLDITFK
jgi:hypothetical protein